MTLNMSENKDEQKNQVTVQFPDGAVRKIVTGDLIEDQESHIILECEHARYWLNKSSIDWIKYNNQNK